MSVVHADKLDRFRKSLHYTIDLYVDLLAPVATENLEPPPSDLERKYANEALSKMGYLPGRSGK